MKKQNDQPIKEVLQQMVDQLRLRNKLNQTKIQQLWVDLMGPSISKHTTSIQVRRKKLYLNINSASLKSELSYAREKIRTLINEELGEDYIEDVIIR